MPDILATITPIDGTSFQQGSYQWHMWEGQLQPRKPVVDVFRRIGQLGSCVQKMGYRADPSQIQAAAAFSDLPTALAFWQNAAFDLGGSIVSVAQPTAVWPRAIIHQATDIRIRAGRYSFGGSSEGAFPYIVTATMIIEAQ